MTDRQQQTSDEEIGERFRTLIDRMAPTVVADQVTRESKVTHLPSRSYGARAIVWVAAVAVLVVALFAGVHAATAGKTKSVTPASPSTHSSSPQKGTSSPHVPHVRVTIHPTTTTTFNMSTGTTTHVGATQTTVPLSTTTTVPPTTVPLASTPLFVAPGFNGREPVDIYLSGDAGNIVTNLTWSVWSTNEAVGYGTSNYLTCNPDCASGPSYPEPTSITLTDPVDGKFTNMTEVKMKYTIVFVYGHQWAEEAS